MKLRSSSTGMRGRGVRIKLRSPSSYTKNGTSESQNEVLVNRAEPVVYERVASSRGVMPTSRSPARVIVESYKDAGRSPSRDQIDVGG